MMNALAATGTAFRTLRQALLRPWAQTPRACRHQPVLSQQQRRQFHQDGYLIFDPGLARDLADRVREELRGKFSSVPPGTPGFPLCGRIQDAWKYSPAVKELARAPRVLAALRDLYGREPLPFQTLNFPVGTEQPIHSDTIHFNSQPAGGMCGVWVALEDIDLDNGPLAYYPGSHRLPEFTPEDVGVPVVMGSHEHYKDYERFIARFIETEGLQPRHATIRQGEALVWASNLLHGGMPRRDRNRSRFTQATHYFFAGYRYYTPLFSTEDQVCWRRPAWIT